MKPDTSTNSPEDIKSAYKQEVELTYDNYQRFEKSAIEQLIRRTANNPIPRVRSEFLEILAEIIAGNETSYQWHYSVDFKWLYRTKDIKYRGKSNFHNCEMDMYANLAFPFGVNRIKVGKYEVIKEPTGMPNESKYVFINPADYKPAAELFKKQRGNEQKTATMIGPKEKVFMKHEIKITVGQLWRDCDPRTSTRFLLVKSVSENRVMCENLRTGTITTIDKSRMKPGSTGYALVLDAELARELQKQVIKAASRAQAFHIRTESSEIHEDKEHNK